MLMRALHPFRDWLPGDTVDVPTDQCRDLIIAEIVEPYTPDQLADLEPDDLPAPAGEPTAAPKGFTEADNPPWQAEAFATVEDGAALDAQAAALFPDDDPGPTSETA
jgi:hypothetical protein